MNWKDWKKRSKWQKVKQLPRWVKKGFGWYCPLDSEKTCPKHGLYSSQHPKYLKGNNYEYKIVDVKESWNNYQAVLKRVRWGKNFKSLIFSIRMVRKIRWFIIRKYIANKWVDTNNNVPDWVKRKLKNIQIYDKSPAFVFNNKIWIIEGRYSVYKIIFLNREEYSGIYRKRKVKGIISDYQYTDPKEMKKIDTKGKKITVDDLLRAANFIKK
jgi:hypothetical protein